MSNVYYELYYHIIWSTKKRIELIDDGIGKILKENILKKIKELEAQQLEFNSYLDHCHLLATIPPKISISDFVGKIKGYSSYEINKIKGEKYIQWQRGFGVLSLNKKGILFVKKYIKNQRQHHKNKTVIDVLEFVPEEK